MCVCVLCTEWWLEKGEGEGWQTACWRWSMCFTPPPPRYPSPLCSLFGRDESAPAQHCSSHQEGTLSPCPSLFITVHLSIYPSLSLTPPIKSLHIFPHSPSICVISCLSPSLPPALFSSCFVVLVCFILLTTFGGKEVHRRYQTMTGRNAVLHPCFLCTLIDT